MKPQNNFFDLVRVLMALSNALISFFVTLTGLLDELNDFNACPKILVISAKIKRIMKIHEIKYNGRRRAVTTSD